MLTTKKSLRVLGLAGVAGALMLVQACAPNTGGDADVTLADESLTACTSRTCFEICRADNCLQKALPARQPPAGYVVKWSTCTYYVESDVAMRNNSRVVNAAADGTIPLQRAEPVDGGKDNFRRIKFDLLGKNVLKGNGKDYDGQGVRFVKLGQAVSTKEADGSIVQWVVGSSNLGNPAFNKIKNRYEYKDHCFRNPALVGKDTAGRVTSGSELAVTCVVEESRAEWNALSAYGWAPLVNFATAKVGTSNDPTTRPHPDAATYEGYSAPAHYYGGTGAALNDINGAERDASTNYIGGEAYCHMIISGGLEVPGAKRPDTKSFPAPGIVNVKSYIAWKPVNPNVMIANDQLAAPDPVEPEPEPAPEPVSADDTLPM